MTKIVCISDTHEYHNKLEMPEADFIIHAGDFTRSGDIEKIIDFNLWLDRLLYKYKIVIAGNHDLLFDDDHPQYKGNNKLARSLLTNCIYLQDSGIEIEGIKFWGSPQTLYYKGWAFNQRQNKIKKYWNLIPNNTDILITHGPPYEILDLARRGRRTGCRELLEKVKMIKPKYHIFGHIHESYGREENYGIKFINACNVNEYYSLVHKPIVFEY